jgi:hypothetical protein
VSAKRRRFTVFYQQSVDEHVHTFLSLWLAARREDWIC